MATITRSVAPQRPGWRNVNYRAFVEEHITRSWLLTLWLLILAGVTIGFTVSQLSAAPITTAIIVIAWAIGLGIAVTSEVRRQHTPVSRWLKNSLFGSISNALITLFLVLVLLAAARGLWNWAWVNATFSVSETAPDVRSKSGANWGVVWGARKLLLTGRLAAVHNWRIWLSLGFVIVAGVVSFFAYRPPLRDRVKPLRQVLTGLWILSPILLFIFLRGAPEISVSLLITLEVLILASYVVLYFFKVVKFSIPSAVAWVLAWPLLYGLFAIIRQSGIFPDIDVNTWGGLLFTMIISVTAIVASFPLGMILALGRRSTVQGIPIWLAWPVVILATIYYLFSSTPALLENARNPVEQALSFWPLLLLGLTYAFYKLFKGNVVSAASTVYIEVVRGVPLITVLFMAVIMKGLFLPPGTDANSFPAAYAVMIGFSLFTAAYLAENIRGGLQSIPSGQYEAADAIGLNTLQKMRFIILPQALRAVIPAIVGLFIGVFKDSSLVAIVGLFDLLGIINPIIANPEYLGLRRELYLFAAIIYFIGSFAMSSYSRRLEERLGVGQR